MFFCSLLWTQYSTGTCNFTNHCSNIRKLSIPNIFRSQSHHSDDKGRPLQSKGWRRIHQHWLNTLVSYSLLHGKNSWWYFKSMLQFFNSGELKHCHQPSYLHTLSRSFMLANWKLRNYIPLQAKPRDSIHRKFASSDRHQQPYRSDTATAHPLENEKHAV